MEHCGREIGDEQLRASIRETGIGTPAIRAAVIETLFARGYIRREKKSLVPTDKGMAIHETVKDKKIANVEMTAAWEDTLARIESRAFFLPPSCPAPRNYSSSSIRSSLKMTGRVPSLQHVIITFSSFVQPRIIEPPCRAE